MKLNISTSAETHDFAKGDRIVAKAGKNEWFVGTVMSAGKKLKLHFDDGASATIDPEDFKDVKPIDPKTKKLKKTLTNAEAKVLVQAGKPAKTLKAAKQKVAEIKAKPVKTVVPAKPVATGYTAWAAKWTLAKAKTYITALEKKVAAINARGMKAARRAEDAGPMDIAWEQCQPLVLQIELLRWHVAHPTQEPKADLLRRFDEWQGAEARNKEWEDTRMQRAGIFPNIVGKTIQWNSRKAHKVMEAVVMKQLPGTRGSHEPRYKAQVLGETGMWTIPNQLVIKVLETKETAALKEMRQKQDTLAVMFATAKPGQTITWSSRRSGAGSGVILGTGRTRFKIQLSDGRRGTVPTSIVTSINGKKV